MHGGARLKAQKLRANLASLKEMEIWCDKSHEHLPWVSWQWGRKTFHTSEEAHYPHELCNKIAVKAAAAVSPTFYKAQFPEKVFELKIKLNEQKKQNAAATARQARAASAQLIV